MIRTRPPLASFLSDEESFTVGIGPDAAILVSGAVVETQWRTP